MIDTHLLEPLLPEIYKVLTEGDVAHFWKMLDVLDRTVQAGRRVSDPVLFSVLLLPYVMQQIEREEAKREGRLRTGEVILFIRELVQPICERMTFAAGVRHQIEQALETLWRLLEPPSERRSMWRFVFRDYFLDALALPEIYPISSGKYVQLYRQWQALAHRVRREDEVAPREPVRHRRRRRSRKP
jgi:hypothetical protein